MDAVGAHRERHVDPVVHEEERARPRGRGPELLGDLEELPAGQVLLAELDGGEPGVERRGHDRDELPSLRRVAVGHEDEGRNRRHARADRIEMPYASNAGSLVTIFIPSRRAWAISRRSKGSVWWWGRAATSSACSTVIGRGRK